MNHYQQCAICGAAIGENNYTGVGGGCMQNIVKPAKRDCFNEIKGLELWVAKATALKNVYVDTFKETKFRSDFKKSFYESMCKAERVSRKQFDIMLNQMSFDYEIRNSIPDFGEIWKDMFNRFDPSYECEDLYRQKLEIHKKLYLSGRKNADYVITKLPKIKITEDIIITND